MVNDGNGAFTVNTSSSGGSSGDDGGGDDDDYDDDYDGDYGGSDSKDIYYRDSCSRIHASAVASCDEDLKVTIEVSVIENNDVKLLPIQSIIYLYGVIIMEVKLLLDQQPNTKLQ